MCVLYMPDVGYRSVVSLDLVCARTCRLLFSAARVHQRSMSHVERGSKVRSGQVGKVRYFRSARVILFHLPTYLGRRHAACTYLTVLL